MWSFGEALDFLFSGIKKFPKLIDFINLINKDSISEVVDVIKSDKDKNMSSGINILMTAFSCTYWINMLYSIISMFFSFHFSKVIGFILSIIISTIIYTLLLMIFYNHKEQWSNIPIKIFVILLILGIVVSVISVITGIFSFSILGVLSIIKNILLIVCYLSMIIGIVEWFVLIVSIVIKKRVD